MIRIALISLLVALFAGSSSAQTTSTVKYKDHWFPETCYRDRQPTSPVDMVMLHFCSDVIQNPDNPFSLERITEIFTSVTVSAHYLIDRDGTVYRFVPEDKAAFHAGRGTVPWLPERHNNLNEFTIGIEMFNIGSAEDMKIFMSKAKYEEFARKHPQFIGYTDAQYAALNGLLADIRSRHPAIKLDRRHIVGHSEYAGPRRTDPGTTFDWTRIGLPSHSEFPTSGTVAAKP